MKDLALKTLLAGACLLLFALPGFAQKQQTKNQSDNGSVAGTLLNGTGKVGVVVVGSAAKAAWVTTKFTAKYVAKPLLLKAAPKVGLFLLKKTAVTAKYVLPAVQKLALL